MTGKLYKHVLAGQLSHADLEAIVEEVRTVAGLGDQDRKDALWIGHWKATKELMGFKVAQ